MTRLRDREAAVDDPRTEVVTRMKTVLTQPGTGSPAAVDVLGPSEHAVDRDPLPGGSSSRSSARGTGAPAAPPRMDSHALPQPNWSCRFKTNRAMPSC